MISSSSVRLLFFEQSIGCDTCAPTRRALEQFVREHGGVTLEIRNPVLDQSEAEAYGVDRVPAVIIIADGRERIRYYGTPLHHEWPTLTEAVAMAASGATGLSENSRERLQALTAPVSVRVFFTPTCVYCPRMISLANQAAIESPMISVVAINAAEFPDLVSRYNVNGVPKTIINGGVELLGAVPEDQFIAALS